MSEPLLSVRGLSVSYGRARAVHEIDLEVSRGEVVGLIGPNGAGKTTTLAAIFGLRPGAVGEVRFAGRSIVGRSPERIARDGLALVPEGRHIFASLTVAENLSLGRIAARGRPQRFDQAYVLSRFPILGEYAGTPAGRLSGGEQQQLAIARALLASPDVLLLDEPSLGLAPLMVNRVFEILAQLREDGVTVLLVEQNAKKTLQFADRSYLMSAGALVFGGSRETMLAQADVSAAYLGTDALGS